MTIECQCKICRTPISVQCDEQYSELGDPFKLTRMLTCNRCYDLRDREQKIRTGIYRVCVRIIQCGHKDREIIVKQAFETMRVLTQKFAKWFQERESGKSIVWDGAFAQMIVEHPDKWSGILEDYKRHTKQLWSAA